VSARAAVVVAATAAARAATDSAPLKFIMPAAPSAAGPPTKVAPAGLLLQRTITGYWQSCSIPVPSPL
jgi:hypothetical protein